MKIKLLLNPEAGRGRAAAAIGRALRTFERRGASVELETSTSREHLSQLAAEASAGNYDRIVACGGDGTVHWVVRGLDRSRATLAVLGLGSGDDFARVIGMPHNIDQACEAIVAGRIRELDVATANGIPFVGVAGLGFDSEVARYANDHVRFLRGSSVYLYSIFRVIQRFKPHEVRVRIGDEVRRERIMFMAVGNTHRYGGGIEVVPSAVPDDGFLDVCIVEQCSRWQLLRTLPLAYSGKHIRRPFVRLERTRQLSVVTMESLEIFADGEPVTTAPVEFAIAPERLRVVVGAAWADRTMKDDGKTILSS